MPVKSFHFLPDSPYSNWYVDNFERVSNDLNAEFYCVSNEATQIHRDRIKVLDEDSDILSSVLEKINSETKCHVFINYLGLGHAEIINRIDNLQAAVFWIAWSADFYCLPKLRFKKYDAYSLKFSKRQEKLEKAKSLKPKYSLKQRLGRLKMIYWDRIDLNKKNQWQTIYKAISRSDYMITGIHEEQKIASKKLNPGIKWIPFAYISATNGIGVENSLEEEKQFILVGNSADPANNQFEIVKKLGALKIEDQILLPLSYGDEVYRNELIKDILKFADKDQIVVLKDFMQKDDYYNVLKKVKSAVFAHNIQQAFGNVIALLAFGSKVFLKKRNFLYGQLKEWGFHVFSIDDEMTVENLTTPFSKETMLHNQTVVFELFAQQKVDEYYLGLVNFRKTGKD